MFYSRKKAIRVRATTEMGETTYEAAELWITDTDTHRCAHIHTSYMLAEWLTVSQSIITTLLARSSRPTLTLYSGLLSSVLRVSLHLLLSPGRSGRRTSGWSSVLLSLLTYRRVGATQIL